MITGLAHIDCVILVGGTEKMCPTMILGDGRLPTHMMDVMV